MVDSVPMNNASPLLNVSSALFPSSVDLLMAVPRLAKKAGSLVLVYLPGQLDGLLAMARNSGSIIADATSKKTASNLTVLNSATAVAQTTVPNPTDAAALSDPGFWASFIDGFGFQRISNIDSIFSYLASRWAVSTFLIAILLNRAHVYASSRRHLRLNWQSRLLIRIVPIVLFVYQVQAILQAMRCQTGTYLPQSAITDTDRVLNSAFTNEGGPLHRLSSTLLFWQSEKDSCLRAGMVAVGNKRPLVYGSSSVLWPLFMSLCISHLMETISCALQGRQPMAETGMTIFEHSLAFAEAEAVVRSSVGLGLFGLPKPSMPPSPTGTSTTSASTAPEKRIITRSMIMQRLNVPPEVLLIALVSSLSHLSSHILGILGLQSRFRLVNTGIWGVCFMCAFVWSFVKFAHSTHQNDIGVLRYPTVCIIGFIPHLMIIAGGAICGIIYVFALLLTVLSPPSRLHAQGTMRQRLVMAHNNLQAHASLSNIHITWQDEFYTTLLKVGFAVLMAASEAVYFNEGALVTVNSLTWLEEKRFDDLARSRAVAENLRSNIPPEIQGGVVADGLSLIDIETLKFDPDVLVHSGYARERKTTKPSTMTGFAAMREEGTGGSQRSGRWFLAWKLLRQVSQLVTYCLAKILAASLRRCGIHRRPNWLRNLATLPVNRGKDQLQKHEEPKSLDFWMLSEDGNLCLPSDPNVDVELETRRRLLHSDGPQDGSEQAIDANLYSWWKSGGWWGEIDSSGEYQPRSGDEDTTSVVSTTDESGWDTENSDEERRTPTQATYERQERESSVLAENPLAHLSRLLDPKSREEKQEAQLLAQRLQNDGPMTRSQYRKILGRQRLRLLAPNGSMMNQTISADEEEDLLEQVLLSRREAALEKKSQNTNPRSWTDGAEGMGDSGPQCVVCHSSPRTILVWPCRCLSLCEECRVSLAMNNFGSCVCCRRDVVAFSRLYVP